MYNFDADKQYILVTEQATLDDETTPSKSSNNLIQLGCTNALFDILAFVC
jgi:hypothetical protein